MKTYTLTVFEKSGAKLLDVTFEATNDEEAKKIGGNRLSEEGYLNHTHRCVSPNGKLLLFHR
ncbi:hypothetical protein NC797_09285 [Aquibacillus sp. 3ASR75-11]|uniref:YhzD-like protein n=1 Tax=Terrihalobacillus insolitus TaxID=2950438 RepID=A0A9X4ALS6_9BACI|nr:YhzD family protein [Terrihalobacillus insolitus]MDC3413541.1 hypothetical protein [Terrihalobacillus insolitus]MDC3424702.1 hypothetical protein [Terrihalobacillus insolitus]